MRKPPYPDWRVTFCVVPDLGVAFERDIYLPYEPGSAPEVRAGVSTAKAAEFIPQAPARLCDTKDDLYTIRINGVEDLLRGTLRLRSLDKGEQRIPLTISISKVKGRLQGLDGVQRALAEIRAQGGATSGFSGGNCIYCDRC